MNHKRLVLSLVVVSLVLTLGLAQWASAQGRGGKGRPVAVAVVDVVKVSEALAERRQIEADLQTKADRLKEEDQNRQKKLEQLQKDVEFLAPGTPARDQKTEELERMALELQAWRSFQTNKINRERTLQIENVYRRMLDAVGRVAKENNYDLVLFKETAINFANARPEQVSAVIQVRKVLWSADDLDLTDEIIQRMNNEFKNSTGAAKPAPTPAPAPVKP